MRIHGAASDETAWDSDVTQPLGRVNWTIVSGLDQVCGRVAMLLLPLAVAWDRIAAAEQDASCATAAIAADSEPRSKPE